MTEVIAEYEPVEDELGALWVPRACARLVGAEWEGWIEFVPVVPGAAVRTPPETTQHSRDAIVDWAGGLRPTYFRGAFERALRRPTLGPEHEPAAPVFDEPSPPIVDRTRSAPPSPPPLLDPYEVNAQGEQRLVDQLAALGTDHLRDIALAYEIVSQERAATASRDELASAILASASAARAAAHRRTLGG